MNGKIAILVVALACQASAGPLELVGSFIDTGRDIARDIARLPFQTASALLGGGRPQFGFGFSSQNGGSSNYKPPQGGFGRPIQAYAEQFAQGINQQVQDQMSQAQQQMTQVQEQLAQGIGQQLQNQMSQAQQQMTQVQQQLAQEINQQVQQQMNQVQQQMGQIQQTQAMLAQMAAQLQEQAQELAAQGQSYPQGFIDSAQGTYGDVMGQGQQLGGNYMDEIDGQFNGGAPFMDQAYAGVQDSYDEITDAIQEPYEDFDPNAVDGSELNTDALFGQPEGNVGAPVMPQVLPQGGSFGANVETPAEPQTLPAEGSADAEVQAQAEPQVPSAEGSAGAEVEAPAVPQLLPGGIQA